MKEHETGNSSPNSSSPRMCADSKYDGAQRKRRTPYSKLHNIACASPCDTKRTVLLVTVVFDLVGKDTTLEIRVLKLSPIGPRDLRYLLFAAFGESIRNGDFCAEELWTVNNKPIGVIVICIRCIRRCYFGPRTSQDACQIRGSVSWQ